MNTPEPNRPEDRLTKGQGLALMPLGLGIYLLLLAASVSIFPGLPLDQSWMGGMIAIIMSTAIIRRGDRPVNWPSFMRIIVVVNLAVIAVALLVAAVLLATGWTEPEWVGVTVGAGATMLIAWLATERIIRVMTRRDHDARDDGKGPA